MLNHQRTNVPTHRHSTLANFLKACVFLAAFLAIFWGIFPTQAFAATASHSNVNLHQQSHTTAHSTRALTTYQYDNTYPYTTSNCGSSTRSIATWSGAGTTVTFWFSNTCSTAWAEDSMLFAYSSGSWIHRNNDGAELFRGCSFWSCDVYTNQLNDYGSLTSMACGDAEEANGVNYSTGCTTSY